MLTFASVTVAALALALSGTPRMDPLLLLGDRLLAEGLVDEAITEYKRYIFFKRDLPEARTAYAHARIAVAYRSEGRHDKAIDALLEAIAAESDERQRDTWRIDLGVTEMARQRYDLAEFTLLKVEMFSTFAPAKRRAAFLRAICSLSLGKWQEARVAFRTYAQEGDPAAQALGEGIERLLDRAEREKEKSPRLAKTLSSIVPGLGEVYVGEWRGGLNAFAINAWAGFVLTQDIVRRQFLDAVVGSIGRLARFYRANRERAAVAARRFNDKRGRAAVAEILTLMEAK